MQKLLADLCRDYEQGLPPEIISKLLDERHPDWVSLSSPYRQLKPLSLQEVHLSTWFTNHL